MEGRLNSWISGRWVVGDGLENFDPECSELFYFEGVSVSDEGVDGGFVLEVSGTARIFEAFED